MAGLDCDLHLITVFSSLLIPKVLINFIRSELTSKEKIKQAKKNTQYSIINIVILKFYLNE